MRLYRELAIKVERRILDSQRKEDSVDTVIPEKVADPPPEMAIEIATDFDCDETATSETLPTDALTPAPICVDVSAQEPIKTARTALLKESASPKLIRSNSYTLDQPSPMLLKFLDSLGDNPAAAKKRFNKSACSTPKTPSPGNRKKPSRKLSEPAKLCSIYGIQKSAVRRAKAESLDDTKRRLTIHSKGEKVEKFFMKSKTVKDFENLTQQPKTKVISDSSESSPEKQMPKYADPDDDKENLDVSAQVVHGIDMNDTVDDYEKKWVDQEKQNRALEQLNAHNQLLLLHKLESLNLMDRTSTPVPRLFCTEDSQSEQCGEVDARLNETSFYSTIRGESPGPCSMSLVSDAYSKQYLHSIRSFTASPTPQGHMTLRLQQENEDIAATIINSHVRGYLIRRLLRTELVQNIIDNIKNILFMILDANPKEIQLKRGYLMKLNANCERLHDIFFQFTTKERMEVITKDRELLLARLSQRRAKRPASAGTHKLALK